MPFRQPPHRPFAGIAANLGLLLGKAQQALATGRFEDVDAICRDVLRADPKNQPALHLSGIAAFQRGRVAEARAALSAAAAVAPSGPVLLDLAQVERAAGQFGAAIRAVEAAIRVPGAPQVAHLQLADMLEEMGEWSKAQHRYRETLRRWPRFFEAHYNFGSALFKRADAGTAAHHFRQAAILRPQHAPSLRKLGAACQAAGAFAEAAEALQAATVLEPQHSAAWSNLAAALIDAGQPSRAVPAAARALRLAPDRFDVWQNIGIIRHEQGRYCAAIRAFRKALDRDPESAKAWNGLGFALQETGAFSEAEAALQRALALAPDYAEAAFNMATLLLRRGDFERGWSLYEARHRRCPPPATCRPEWTPDASSGARVLIRAEQGLGDTIQFSRYVRKVVELGYDVIFQVQHPLCPLMEQSFPEVKIVSARQSVGHDFQISLMSLPCVFGTRSDTIPADIPYVHVDEDRAKRWRDHLGLSGTKIAISWQGNPDAKVDRGRSIPLDAFAPLAALPGVRLISLQKGFGSEQIASVNFSVEDLGPDFDTGPGAFLDTAAVMRAVDLVITSDTAVAHLAGALGCPTWLALKAVPEWRWLTDRADTPWYPSMRLFRQRQAGDWRGVFGEMAAMIGKS